jgi:hypothetical protein
MSRAEINALSEVQRVNERRWKDELAQEREAADAQFEQLPTHRAWRYLKQQEAGGNERLAALGPVELEYSAVVAILGKDVAEKRFQSLLQKYDKAEEFGGLHPDHLAAILGAESGEKLLSDMVLLPDRATWVDARAEAMMQAKHPDVLSERVRLKDLVENALHDEPSVVEELHKQWAEDRKTAGRRMGRPSRRSVPRRGSSSAGSSSSKYSLAATTTPSERPSASARPRRRRATTRRPPCSRSSGS